MTYKTIAHGNRWPILEDDPSAWAGLVDEHSARSALAAPGAIEILRLYKGGIEETRDRWQAIIEGRWDPWA